MTDEIERVRELFEEAWREVALSGSVDQELLIAALAKRLQPKPTPAPKVWSVSGDTAWKFYRESSAATTKKSCDAEIVVRGLNAIVDDILRDRPDAVAKEYQRRYRATFHDNPSLKNLFPEVEG